MKIAIYSGAIPSTTFIENVIVALAKAHVKVYLFGKTYRRMSYPSSVFIYGTPKNQYYNILVTCFRSLLLFLRFPKRFFILINKISTYHSLKTKWGWWSRYVPVLLHMPNVFHIQWAKDIEHWIFLKEHFNCKIVLSLLGSHINYSPIADLSLAASYRKHFSKVDAFQGVSHAINQEAQKYGASAEKLYRIHSTISPHLFDTFKKKQANKSTFLKIVSVGRHHWVKGYEYALKTMALLKENEVAFQYDIIAQGLVPESLLFLQNILELNDCVHFKKGIGQDDLFLVLQDYDVLLLPSLSEGIANVVLEAMAIGLPVISTDCGGMAEVVIHNETGWLVPVRDPEAMAKTIEGMMKTPEPELQRITFNAHEFVKHHFDAEDSIAQFLTLYENVMLSEDGI
ncbi:glycosyltransferase family 4 protein [Aestuariivivens sp. NBU2969]|uniref:glycosyltransferase family 4 protein n=1 Tax=Aestuariivivens sp. NBU2969 TaxID=2873267 RepID=UPI001CBC4601|nr:glycosyltransferase [Aestuariivivens sp. NBU2969]